jgi:hypothetical protein
MPWVPRRARRRSNEARHGGNCGFHAPEAGRGRHSISFN